MEKTGKEKPNGTGLDLDQGAAKALTQVYPP